MDGLFCTFYLSDLYFGVPVALVQEILRPLPITPVPLAKPEISGLLNLRGQIVTAIDLRARLGMPAVKDATQSMNLVVQTQDGPVSLLVDRIADVVTANQNDFEPAPDTLRGPARELTSGAFKLPQQLLLILDVDRAIALPNPPSSSPL